MAEFWNMGGYAAFVWPVYALAGVVMVAILVPIFWIGIYPKPFFEVLHEPVTRLVQQVEGEYQYPQAVVALRPEMFESEGETMAAVTPEPAGASEIGARSAP